ncbi:MAG: hypothetical protein AB7L94_33510 [Kofleriaceae bacterium]
MNMSTLQTAKALDPGKQRILVGGGYYASPSVDADASEATGDDVSLALPYMEIGYRRGLMKNFELGAKATIPGTVGLDGKYQLVSAGKFAVAAGLGTSYLKIESGSDADKVSTMLVDVIVPAYVSYDVAEPFSVYASPKYVLRYASSTDMMDTTSGTSHLVGATVGTRIGSRLGLFLESSYLKDMTSDFDSFQVNGSIFF